MKLLIIILFPLFCFSQDTTILEKACILRPTLGGINGDSIIWSVLKPGNSYGQHTTLNMNNAIVAAINTSQLKLTYNFPSLSTDSVISFHALPDDVFNNAGITFGESCGPDYMIIQPVFKFKAGGYITMNGTKFGTCRGDGISAQSFDSTTGKITIAVQPAIEPYTLSKYTVSLQRLSGVSWLIGFPTIATNENTTTTLAIYIIGLDGQPIKKFSNGVGFNISGPEIKGTFYVIKPPLWQRGWINNLSAIIIEMKVKRKINIPNS